MIKSFLDEWLDARADAEINLGESGVANRRLSQIIPSDRLADVLGEIDFDHNPTRGSDELRTEAAHLYEHASPGNVLITAGASEAILAYFLARREEGCNVVVLAPAFHSLYDVPAALGYEVRQIALDYGAGYRLPVDQIVECVDARTRCVVLTTPNNPMGTVFETQEILSLAGALETLDCDLMLDEQYRLLPHDESLTRFESLACKTPRILSVGSAGKCYGAVGLRVGWVVADEALVEKMDAVKMLTTHAISKMSDRICLELMRGGGDLLQANRTAIGRNKQCLQEVMAHHPGKIAWVEPKGGSVAFPYLADGACSRAFGQRLYTEAGVLVLPGEAFDCPGFFRIRLGAEPEGFAQAMDRMSALL
ncbi:MAG: pyridoxal phosphate-dependent aminotransferase [Pseudomonadota bacterium]